MLPGSHVSPINTIVAPVFQDPRALADAFSEFISASSVLEASYRNLQEEVARLGTELAERNAALSRTLAENDRMRATLQQMIDSLPCGVLVLDSAREIVMINPEGRRLLGLGSRRVRHLADLAAFSRIDLQAYAAISESCLETEVCVASGSGDRWLAIARQELASGSSCRESAVGRPCLQSIWILRDITASKQAEQKREEARSAVALAEISTILAHEIRNPLASMELFAGLMEDDPDQSAQWLSNLRAGIRLLSGTVNNVLSIHCGAFPPLAPVDLGICIRGGVDFVQPIADQAGVYLSFAGSDDALEIQGNEDGIRQIMLNLVGNAIRHTQTGGSIRVSARRGTRNGAPSAIVEVADSGPGIPAEWMDHLFDSGFSGNGNTPGLGLAVCKRLMTRHGGEIRVTSRIGFGTTFALEFPLL